MAVKAILPAAILEWAVPEALEAVTTFVQSKHKVGSQLMKSPSKFIVTLQVLRTEFPAEKVHARLRETGGRDRVRLDMEPVLYAMAVLDYLAADVLKVLSARSKLH